MFGGFLESEFVVLKNKGFRVISFLGRRFEVSRKKGFKALRFLRFKVLRFLGNVLTP
jgi:hypothetical protein